MLTAADREEISRGIAQDQPGVVIAARIGRDPSVISREISRHGGRDRYRASRAARVAARARRRPKTRKLDADPGLRARVLHRLRAGWSPDQIAGRLRHEQAGEQAGRVTGPVSHEAIYTWLYALPKGELARQGILLRSGRTQRRPRRRATTPGARIVGMRCIDDRPAEVADRRVPGHWEGDRATRKSHVRSGDTDWRLDGEGVTRSSVNRIVPALACVMGDRGVRSPGKSRSRSRSIRGWWARGRPDG
jgi:transposase, IS30 family